MLYYRYQIRRVTNLYTKCEFSNVATKTLWHAVAQLVEALRYKPESRGFDSRWFSPEFIIYVIRTVSLWPWGWLSLQQK